MVSKLTLMMILMLCVGRYDFATAIFGSSFYTNVDAIPKEYFRERREISGVIVHVHDGDTYRMRHMPNFLSSSEFTGTLKDNTINIRIAAVDTPEIGGKRKPGQKYSLEAKQFAEKKNTWKESDCKMPRER